MKSFKEWTDQKNTSKKNRLCIFDFDGTLADTPLKPESGQDRRSWNGKDWWASHASLNSPEKGGFYNGEMNDVVVNAMRKAKTDVNTKVIVLTGRRSPIAHKVREVLRNNQLFGKRIVDPLQQREYDRFQQELKDGTDSMHPRENDADAHEEYYTGDHKVTNGIPGTFGHKKHVIEKLVTDNGGFETVELWDDRKDHIELFKTSAREFLKTGLVKNFIIHQVYSIPGAPAYVVDMPITLNTTWKTHG